LFAGLPFFPSATAREERLERLPIRCISRVMAGQQPVEDGRERPDIPATHASLPAVSQEKKDVDARDKRGHDGKKVIQPNRKPLRTNGRVTGLVNVRCDPVSAHDGHARY
jgi:hypothetical protein